MTRSSAILCEFLIFLSIHWVLWDSHLRLSFMVEGWESFFFSPLKQENIFLKKSKQENTISLCSKSKALLAVRTKIHHYIYNSLCIAGSRLPSVLWSNFPSGAFIWDVNFPSYDFFFLINITFGKVHRFLCPDFVRN